jgi:uncharacterized protein YfaQ (DUF2300 family)
MGTFRDPDGRGRGTPLATGAAAVLVLFVLGWLASSRSSEPAPGAPRRRPQTLYAEPAPEAAPSAVAASGAAAPAARVDAPKVQTRADVAKAMDQTGARSAVGLLIQAAAQDDASLKTDMLRSLKRYGAAARPALEDAVKSATNPVVIATLNEALAHAR